MSTRKKTSNAKARTPEPQTPARPGFALVGWFIAAALWLFLAASLLSHHPADPPGYAVAPLNDPPANWCGPAGAFLAHHLLMAFGLGAWVIVGASGALLGLAASGRRVDQLGLRAIGLALTALAFSAAVTLLAPGASASPQGSGGLIAIVGVAELSERFGGLGAALWIALIGMVGVIVAFDRWIAMAPLAAWRWASAGAAVGARATGGLAERARRVRQRENDLDDDRPRVGRRETLPDAEAEDEYEDAYEEDEDWEEDEDDGEYEDDDAEELAEDDEEIEPEPEPAAALSEEELRAKIANLPVRFAASSRRSATQEELSEIQAQNLSDETYVFPSLELLEEPEQGFERKMEADVRERAEALEEAMREYRIKGEVVGIESGPVITLYEVRLAPGTKVSQITAVAPDLARAMRVVNVRIVTNMEGRDTIGVEAPNTEKERVRLKELMTGSDKAARMRLPMFLGKDASGEPLVYDLAAMPHMLIAGTTGSGKSVAINAIIMGFLFTKKPSDLKLVLVDPKMVELSQFRDVPHLMCPVVTDMGKAAAILEWAVGKMDERYELLAEAGCRDIDTYNDLEWEEIKERFGCETDEEAARIPRKLPRIVFIIDELADLMLTHKEVESSIVRIAQKARAVGIHLVLATQRPQANVVTGLIKSNMPSRMAFKVASGMDSRIVLDQKGGELLLGQGDMLFLSPRSSKLMRAQGTLVEDREVRKTVRFLRDVSKPSFERTLVQIRSDGSAGPAETGQGAATDWRQNAEEDPLFDRAVEIVTETQRGSVSLLQRRLAIGYTRASRLIELMGMSGLLGEHKGSVAREVLITREEWDAMRALADREASETEPTGREAAWQREVEHASRPVESPEPAPFDIDDDTPPDSGPPSPPLPPDDSPHAPEDSADASDDEDDAPAPTAAPVPELKPAPRPEPEPADDALDDAQELDEDEEDDDEDDGEEYDEDEEDDDPDAEDAVETEEDEEVDDEEGEWEDDEEGEWEEEDAAEDSDDAEEEDDDEDEEGEGDDAEYEYEWEYVDEYVDEDEADDDSEEDDDSDEDEEENPPSRR